MTVKHIQIPLRHFILLAVPFLVAKGAIAENANAAPAETYGVLFYADWCASCKVLEPKIKEARASLAKDTPVLFVTLDLTDEGSRNQAAMLASLVNIESIYAAHSGKTGFMLLVDAKSKEVRQTLTKTDSLQTIRTALGGGS